MLVFLLPGVSKVTIVTLYFTANDFFVEQFCVNTAQEDSCCKGKCFITEEFTKQENSNENTPKNLTETEIKLVFIQPIKNVCLSQEGWHTCTFQEEKFTQTKDFNSKVYRPPISQVFFLEPISKSSIL